MRQATSTTQESLQPVRETHGASLLQEQDSNSKIPWFGLSGVLLSHAAIDYFTAFVPAALIFLEGRCQMTPSQSAWLLGAGSLISGISQPASAYLGDRWRSRIAAPIGLCMSAIGLAYMGRMGSYGLLFAIYALSMLGAGIYHPVAAAAAGDLVGFRRSLGISGFFIAGMLGQTLGSVVAGRTAGRMESVGMLWEILLIGAIISGICYHSTPSPRRRKFARSVASPPAGEKIRLLPIVMLYICAAMRFTVNMAIVFLYGRWGDEIAMKLSSSTEPRVIAAGIAGELQAATTFGMAIGGLAAGVMVRSGREKWPLVLVPLLASPAIWLLPETSGLIRYLLATCAGFGFAAMIPVGISVMQHLLPNHVAFASGLMLGGAWSIAVVGPPLANYILHYFGLKIAFASVASLLALSGLILVPVDLHRFSPQKN